MTSKSIMLKEFKNSIKPWIEKDGPYWPDWDKVETFLIRVWDEAYRAGGAYVGKVKREAYQMGYSEGQKDNMKVMGMKIPDNVKVTKLK